jgi:hypothetical protein
VPTTRGQVEPPRRESASEAEYQYFVHAKALDAFIDTIRKQRVLLPERNVTPHLMFTSPQKLDMKSCKENGLIWSYSIVRLHRDQGLVERG